MRSSPRGCSCGCAARGELPPTSWETWERAGPAWSSWTCVARTAWRWGAVLVGREWASWFLASRWTATRIRGGGRRRGLGSSLLSWKWIPSPSLQHFTGRHSQVQEGAGGAGRRGWNGDLSLLLSGVTPRDLPSLPEGLGGAVGLSFALGSRKWGRRQAHEWSWPLPVLLDTIRAARSPNLAEARLESCETCGRVHGVDGSAWTGPGRVARGGVILGGLQGRGTNSRGFREAVNERDRSVLIEVPGGLFPMGTDEGALHEEPVHAVRVASLWIGKYPVTNEQFRRFVCANGA